MSSPHANKKFIVDTNQAPRAIGPYSQGVGYGGLLFVSAQLPINAETGEVNQGGIESQTRLVMNNFQQVLMAAGLDFSHVVRTTIYLRNMNDLQLMSDVYGLYFDHSPPARSIVEVSRLPKDVLVSLDAIAAAPTDYAARIEEEPEAENAHFGPDDWEAKHKEEANAVHQTVVATPGLSHEPEDEPGGPIDQPDEPVRPSVDSGEAVPGDGGVDSKEGIQPLAAADSISDADDEPPPAADGIDPFATRELSVDDIEEADSPSPKSLKIPRLPKSKDD